MSANIFIVKGNDNTTYLCVEASTGRSDFPIRYSDKSIAYDFPEHIPQRIKDKVASMFQKAYEQGEQFDNDRFGR